MDILSLWLLSIVGGTAFLAAFTRWGACSGDATITYTNPIGGGTAMADPCALKHDGRYWLYATSAGDGYRGWKSPDLVHWEPLGYVFRRTEKTWATKSFWAPEVAFYRGRFYMVYSAQGKGVEGFRICMAVADSPEGPFEDLHAPLFDNGWSCIDAHLFIDDGAPYLFFDKVGAVPEPDKHMYGVIYAAPLKADLSGLASEPVEVARAELPWEEPQSNLSRCNEGAFVFRRGDRYYMTFSVSHYASPKYGIGYATAPSPLGPWTKPAGNPLAVTDRALGVSGPGHNSVTTSPDGKEWFVVYHAHADPDKPSGRRVLCIDRLEFTPEGGLKLLGPTRSPQPMPSGSPEPRQ
jgi:beta-xylosidase